MLFSTPRIVSILMLLAILFISLMLSSYVEGMDTAKPPTATAKTAETAKTTLTDILPTVKPMPTAKPPSAKPPSASAAAAPAAATSPSSTPAAATSTTTTSAAATSTAKASETINKEAPATKGYSASGIIIPSDAIALGNSKNKLLTVADIKDTLQKSDAVQQLLTSLPVKKPTPQ